MRRAVARLKVRCKLIGESPAIPSIHIVTVEGNKSFLTAIRTIIETKSKSTIYKTTSEQSKSIEEGRAQIARGEYFTNEQVEMEIDKWLSEK
jgi:hypothetical protein